MTVTTGDLSRTVIVGTWRRRFVTWRRSLPRRGAWTRSRVSLTSTMRCVPFYLLERAGMSNKFYRLKVTDFIYFDTEDDLLAFVDTFDILEFEAEECEWVEDEEGGNESVN